MKITVNLTKKNTYVESINMYGCDHEIASIVHTFDRTGFDAIIMGGIEIVYDKASNKIFADGEFESDTMDELESYLHQAFEEHWEDFIKFNLPPMGDMLIVIMRVLRAAYDECNEA